MTFRIHRRTFMGGAAALAGSAMLPRGAFAELPGTMQWTASDVGSSGYVEATAIANALIEKHGTRIRIVPSGTSIGRMMQLKQGRVNMGFLANECFFATEAIFDFETREWGPQDLRALMGREALFGIVTAADSGVKTLADLKGKRVARIQAHPSTNFKVEGVLAFAGLSWDDVEVVEVPAYSAGIQAVIDGNVVAAGAVIGASLLRELEASPRGIYWPPVPADDQEGWDRINRAAPLFAPSTMVNGPGATPENPVPLVAYRYPILSVYADRDADEVYELTKAIVEAYGLYKNAAPVMSAYDVKEAGHPPFDAPVHEGAKRYYQEIGNWTEEDEVWNEARLERLKAVQAAWDGAVEEADQNGVPDAQWPEFWAEYRATHLG
ncbi:TAXI family TRAP transporter solute-binding subunit [Lutibaculum baratangense]|uniref:TRAP transporter solute receptor, TAXI family n=1 Tax=Lutibaculum baratangense AMV1 TaxID=631454 RepID=V4QTD8_9HYPH|nr:TAXI family TRAP transporter solute-binding subunit [Lutibaculum baratangense]ESR23012.1 TRAP transporter solute receptor, TAXI family precursor, unknown substrate 2 [Lutibaculum baratangense AMV1]